MKEASDVKDFIEDPVMPLSTASGHLVGTVMEPSPSFGAAGAGSDRSSNGGVSVVYFGRFTLPRSPYM